MALVKQLSAPCLNNTLDVRLTNFIAQNLHLFISAFAGLFVTFISISLLRPLAHHIGLVDMPGGRKMHANNTPLIGGIAIFIGFCFMLLCLNFSLHYYRGLLAGGAILMLIGVLDDLHELRPKVRLVGQLLAVVCLIRWGHMSVSNLGNLFFLGVTHVTLLSYVITFLSVLLFINATNMIDGHDGVAGSVVLSQLLFLLPLSIQFGHSVDPYVLAFTAIILCVFLFYNFPVPWRKRASIFLGDAGSTFLGFLVAWFAVGLSQAMLSQQLHVPGYNLTTLLWILAFPIFDLLSVFTHRLRQKRSPFSPARDHLHHLLLNNGVSSAGVSVLLFVLSIGFGGVAMLLAHWHVAEPWQLVLYLCVFFSYLIVCHLLRREYLSSDRDSLQITLDLN